MSGIFGSTIDEFGSLGIKVELRQLSDIADDKGTYFLMKDGIFTVSRTVSITQDKPLVFRAFSRVRLTGAINPWFYVGSDSMFKTFTLKKGDITEFADNTTNTLVTTDSDHELNVGDVVRIIDSRVGIYDGLQTVSVVPSSTTFEIDVTFAGTDGQCRFTQSQVFISSMAESTLSTPISDLALVLGGNGYQLGETLTVIGETSTASNATATVDSVIDGIVSTISIDDAGTGYSNGTDIVLDEGSGSDATLDIDSVGGSGEITSVTLNNPGTGYVVSDTLIVVGGVGGTITVDSVTDGVIDSISLVNVGSLYSDGETVQLHGLTSFAVNATATVVTGAALTTLTIINHNLDDDISISITSSTNSTDGQFIISNVTTDTVDIEFEFVSTGTGLIDVGMRTLEIENEAFVKLGTPAERSNFMDLETNIEGGVPSIVIEASVIIRFDIGETRGFGGTIASEGGALVDCTGWLIIDNGFFTMTDLGANSIITPTTTSQYAPCVRIAPHADEHRTVRLQFNTILFEEFQSFVEIPTTINPDGSYSVLGLTDAAPATVFSLGFVAVAENTPITDEGGGTIKIFVDQTIRYREGDEIEILASTSYTGDIGTIQSGGIVKDTSIVVDITFVAGDTGVTLRDNTLASRDQTDPQVLGALNGGIADSLTTANAFLPFDANLTVTISAAATPVPIGGTWTFTETERVDGNTSGGIATYIGKETRKVSVTFGGTVTGAASAIFAFQIVRNGIDITDTPPIINLTNASTAVSVGALQIVELEQDDTLQVFISNPAGTQDPTVHASHLTIAQI